MKTSPKLCGFTLVELLTVIAIIAVLMGLLFPAIGSAKDSARRAQAKNDCVQIVTAVKAYYTEYGKYPTDSTSDVRLIGNDNSSILQPLVSGSGTLNPRQIVFLEVPDKSEQTAPKSGMKNNIWYDPWGKAYRIAVDSDYDNKVTNPYSGASTNINTGVIAWSVGKDGAQASTFANSDDVASWQ